jgi:hypothetical protein
VLHQPSTGDITVSGLLTLPDGQPVTGTVAAVAWPNERATRALTAGSRAPLQTVGWATAGIDGRYVIVIDAARIHADRLNDDGFVNVQFTGWNDSAQGMWQAPLQLRPHAGHARLIATGQKSDDELRITLDQPRESGTPAVTGQTTPDIVCLPAWWVLDNTSSSLRFWETLAGTYPWGSQTGSATFGSSNTTVLGVAVSASGTYGTWSASGTYTISEGITTGFTPSTAYRYYNLLEQWAKLGYGTGPQCGGSYTSYKVQPYKYSGGTQAPSTTWKNYTYSCVEEAAGVSQTRQRTDGFDFKMSGGVKSSSTLGISLSSQADWSTAHSVTYVWPSAGHWCGKDANPAYASDTTGAP